LKKPIISIMIIAILLIGLASAVFEITHKKHQIAQPAKQNTHVKRPTPAIKPKHSEPPIKPKTTVKTSPKYISGFVIFYDKGTSQKEWIRNAGSLKEVYLDSATIRPDGNVDNFTPPAASKIVSKYKQKAQIAVSNYGHTNFDSHELKTILENPKRSQKLVTNLVKMVKNTPYSGINIDFEQNPPGNAKPFVSFLSALHTAVQKEHKTLSIDVPPKTKNDTWDTGYDYVGIGKNVDEVLIMAYDYSYPGGKAGPIAPVGWVKSVLQYSVATIPVSKLKLGLPMYGYDWHGHTTEGLNLSKVDNLMAQHKLKPKWDATDQEPYFTYQDASTGKNTVFYENQASINAKLQVAKQFHIPGIFTWYIGSGDTGTWNNIQNY
jgi:spore germination protein YaaH